MKKLIYILSFICAVNAAAADVLFLNQGEEHIGNLISIKGEEISFKDLNSNEAKAFNSKEIAHILISKNRQGDEINSVKDIKDPIAKQVLSNLPNPADFPNNDYITLYSHTEIEHLSESEILIKRRNLTQILKEPGLSCGNQSYFYNSETTDCRIEFAHTYSPDGNVFHLTDDALSEESLYNATPEYAKIKKIKFAMKKVDLGSIIDSMVVKKITKIGPLSPTSFRNTFGEREPVLHEEITYKFPKDMILKKLELQWEKNCPKFTEKTEDNKVVWNWVFSDPEGFIQEQNMLPLSRIFPRIVIFKEYDKNLTASLLAEAYKEAEVADTQLIEFMVKAEISDKDTDYDKVCKVYDFLNKEIAGIGMGPDDMESFKPMSAKVTISKKYANAQATLALFHSMLKKLGIKSYVGFANGKREKVTYSNNANLDFATIPVLKVVMDGESFYTDGGSIYTPFSVISTGLQGSEATFLDEENKVFFTDKLPIQELDWNTRNQVVCVKIQKDGTMDVNETITYRGPFEQDIRGLKSLKEKEKSNYAERRVKSIHPNAILKGYGFTDMADLGSPAVYNISYSIPNAAQKASDNIMSFTNFWINYSAGSVSLEKRKYPMTYWARECTTKTIIFQLPEDFNWVKWDKQYKYNSANLSFASNISQNNNQIIYSDRFQISTDEFLDDSSYQEYRKCLLTMSELANQWLIIEK